MDVLQSYLSTCLADGTISTNLLVNAIRDGPLQISREWVDFVNSCLRGKFKARVGLMVLEITVRNCSPELLIEHGIYWLQHLIRHIQSPSSDDSFITSVHLISSIVQFLPQFPDLSREVAVQLLQELVAALLSVPSQLFLPSVECLSCCIQSLPGPMGPHKNRIETWLLEQATPTSTDENMWKAAARCFALLPRVGGGGQGGVKHGEAWNQLCQQLIITMRCILAAMLPPTSQETQGDGGKDRQQIAGFGVENLPLTEPNRMSTLLHRFKFLSRSLYHSLTTEFPVTVAVPVNSVMAVISKALSIDPQTLASGGQHAERIPLIAAIPFIQRVVYQVLAGLISSCRQVLLPFCGIIDSFFVQTLTWTRGERQLGVAFPYSSLRIEVYETIKLWLAVGGNCTDSTVVDQTIAHMLADANADKLEDSREGNNSSDTLPPPRKKRKGKRSENALTTSFGQTKRCFAVNKDLCQASLEAMHRILVVRGPQLSAKSLQSVLDFTIPILCDCQQSVLGQAPFLAKPSTWSRFPPDPYFSLECRLLLYQLLKCCVLSSNHLVAIPAQQAMSIFSRGIQDTSLQVSLLCHECLAICDLVIHPRLPSLLRTPAPHLLTSDEMAGTTSKDSRVSVTTLPKTPVSSPTAVSADTWQLADSTPSFDSSVGEGQQQIETAGIAPTETQLEKERIPVHRLSTRNLATELGSSEHVAARLTSEPPEETVDIVVSHDDRSCDSIRPETSASESIVLDHCEDNGAKKLNGGEVSVEEMLATFVDAPPD